MCVCEACVAQVFAQTSDSDGRGKGERASLRSFSQRRGECRVHHGLFIVFDFCFVLPRLLSMSRWCSSSALLFSFSRCCCWDFKRLSHAHTQRRRRRNTCLDSPIRLGLVGLRYHRLSPTHSACWRSLHSSCVFSLLLVYSLPRSGVCVRPAGGEWRQAGVVVSFFSLLLLFIGELCV